MDLAMKDKGVYGEDYFTGIYTYLSKEKKEVLATFFDLLKQRKHQIKSLLDLGCGQGEFMQICTQSGIDAFGVDISDYAINEAKRLRRSRIFQLDLNQEKLPFKDDFFGAITCFDVVEHLESVDSLLTEAYRVLRPGGTLFVTTPNGKMWLREVLRQVAPSDRTHINVQGPKYWQRRLSGSGFVKIKTRGSLLFGLPPGLGVRYWFRQRGLPVRTKPILSPFLPLTTTLFIFAEKLV